MLSFKLDARLERDTTPVAALGLCLMRLRRDSRWPWLILVPQRDAILELHDLTPLDQTMLTFETALVSRAVSSCLSPGKINIAALGNVVPMFHMHVVARSPGDANWPDPVWGFGSATPYTPEAEMQLVERLRDAVFSA